MFQGWMYWRQNMSNSSPSPRHGHCRADLGQGTGMQTKVCIVLSSAESASFKEPTPGKPYTVGTLQGGKFAWVMQEPVLLESTLSAWCRLLPGAHQQQYLCAILNFICWLVCKAGQRFTRPTWFDFPIWKKIILKEILPSVKHLNPVLVLI